MAAVPPLASPVRGRGLRLDGDGVIVVPREYAEPVATAARKVLDGDKATRLQLYKATGRKPDQTVLPSKQ